MRISRRPKIFSDCAAAKPRTTPEPVPTSTTNGDVCLVLSNRSMSHFDSDADDNVSRKRYESSDGS